MTYRRAGHTLIELLAAINSGAIVLAAVVGLLYLLMKVDSTARDDAQATAGVARLAEQFREDVHAAHGIARLETAGLEERWELKLIHGPTVIYRAEANRLARIQSASGVVERTEWYNLPTDASARIELPEEGSPRIARLCIGGSSQAHPYEKAARWTIEAALPDEESGRDAP